MYHKLSIQNSCNTIYPRNIVCCRYVIVNTMHKGDNKEDDDNDDDNNMPQMQSHVKNMMQ